MTRMMNEDFVFWGVGGVGCVAEGKDVWGYSYFLLDSREVI